MKESYPESYHDTHIGCSLPALNLSKDFKGDVYEYRNSRNDYNYDYPIPISKETVHITQDWMDIGTNLVKQHNQFLTKFQLHKNLVIHKKQAEHWKKRLDEREKYNAKLNIYPASCSEFAEYIETNPDPYFQGTYNWYLTGGNVSAIEDENEKNYVLRSFGKNHEFLDLTPINSRRTKLIESKTQRFETGDAESIFEVRTFGDSLSVDLNTLLRKRNTIFVANISPEGCENFVQYPSEIPYISADLCDEQMVVLLADKTLKIYDTTVGKRVGKKINLHENTNFPEDNWGCVRALDEYGFIVGNRSGLRVLDSRTRAISSEFSLLPYGEHCDRLTCIERSKKYPNLMYISTSHKLFAVDLRKFSGELHEKNIALCWSHFLQLPPQMICPIQLETSEMVIVSSNLIGDCVQVTTEKTGAYLNQNSPKILPSLVEAFELVRDAGLYFSPTHQIQKRMKICLSGMCALSDGTIISQNSSCDVFSHKLIEEKSDAKDLIPRFKSWGVLIDIEAPPKVIKATTMVNKVDLVKVLLRPQFDYKIPQIIEPSPTPWKIPLEELAMYQDALASDIMDVWNLPLESTPMLTAAKVNYNEKVESWIMNLNPSEGNVVEEDTFMKDENIMEDTQNFSLYKDESAYSQLADTFNDKDEFVTSTQLTSTQVTATQKSSKNSKKKKHTIGF